MPRFECFQRNCADKVKVAIAWVLHICRVKVIGTFEFTSPKSTACKDIDTMNERCHTW